jgi:hypothetical protein
MDNLAQSCAEIRFTDKPFRTDDFISSSDKLSWLQFKTGGIIIGLINQQTV